MRFAVGVLLCFNAGAVSLALADPVATPPAAAPAAAASSASATAPAAVAPAAATATVPAKPALNPDEKLLISRGYKLEMHGGQKLFCRREQVLGSRLGEQKHCGTADQLKVNQQESRDATEKIQRTEKNPQGG
jgi:hypothetical protein